MNAIEFRVVHTRHWYGHGIRILIDGQDLIELARAIEIRLVASTGDTGPAGDYSGLPAQFYPPPSRHF